MPESDERHAGLAPDQQVDAGKRGVTRRRLRPRATRPTGDGEPDAAATCWREAASQLRSPRTPAPSASAVSSAPSRRAGGRATAGHRVRMRGSRAAASRTSPAVIDGEARRTPGRAGLCPSSASAAGQRAGPTFHGLEPPRPAGAQQGASPLQVLVRRAEQCEPGDRLRDAARRAAGTPAGRELRADAEHAQLGGSVVVRRDPGDDAGLAEPAVEPAPPPGAEHRRREVERRRSRDAAAAPPASRAPARPGSRRRAACGPGPRGARGSAGEGSTAPSAGRPVAVGGAGQRERLGRHRRRRRSRRWSARARSGSGSSRRRRRG